MKNEITVTIKWDKPKDKNWLCPDNIAIALHSYCKNTKFEVKESNNSILPIEITDGKGNSFLLENFDQIIEMRDKLKTYKITKLIFDNDDKENNDETN